MDKGQSGLIFFAGVLKTNNCLIWQAHVVSLQYFVKHECTGPTTRKTNASRLNDFVWV
jgi:hypothetical protein